MERKGPSLRSVVLGTWEGEKMSLSSGMLKGIALLISAYGNSLNEESFKDKVGCVSAKNITRTANDRHPGPMGFAEALILAYNNKNKRRLSVRKLYWTTSKKRGEAPSDFETE